MFTLKKNNMTSLLGDWIYPASAFIAGMFLRMKRGFIFDFFTLLFIFLSLINNKSTSIFGKKEDILLNSMPFKRKDIVKDKYICFLIYIFSINAAFWAGSSLLSNPANKEFEISFCLLMLFMSTIYIAINLPLEYFDNKIAGKLNYFIYIGLMFIPPLLKKIINTDKIFNFMKSAISFLGANTFFIGISLIAYCLSYKISCITYEKKEF